MSADFLFTGKVVLFSFRLSQSGASDVSSSFTADTEAVLVVSWSSNWEVFFAYWANNISIAQGMWDVGGNLNVLNIVHLCKTYIYFTDIFSWSSNMDICGLSFLYTNYIKQPQKFVFMASDENCVNYAARHEFA